MIPIICAKLSSYFLPYRLPAARAANLQTNRHMVDRCYSTTRKSNALRIHAQAPALVYQSAALEMRQQLDIGCIPIKDEALTVPCVTGQQLSLALTRRLLTLRGDNLRRYAYMNLRELLRGGAVDQIDRLLTLFSIGLGVHQGQGTQLFE